MNRFTIRDIENLCLIKAHTLRIWEQRYDFFTSQRKESNHRFYDDRDLQTLLQVAFLYHGGWKISKIAALTTQARTDLIAKERKAGTSNEQDILLLIDAAATFDEPAFRAQSDLSVIQKGLEQAVLQVFYPFLQRVGHLWLTNHVIPAQEHFSANLIQHKIIAETDALPILPPKKPVILLFTPRSEHHELPLLFLNYLFRYYGWHVIYLGSNVNPLQLPPELASRADIFYLHLVTNLTGDLPDTYFETLCRAWPGKTIVASGRAVHGAQRSFRNLHLLKSDEAIQKFVRDY
jgi:DNA-binding transcriptional MerR regulator